MRRVVEDSPMKPKAMITRSPMSISVMIKVKPGEADVAIAPFDGAVHLERCGWEFVGRW